jgi:hypothetical protein
VDWKTLVYEYVYARNRMEARLEPGYVASYIEDPSYYDRQKERATRLQQLHRQREIEPIRREERLRFLGVRSIECGLLVEIGLHNRSAYNSYGLLQQEERKERELLVLTNRRGNWAITAVHSRETEGYQGAEGLAIVKPVAPGGALPESPSPSTGGEEQQVHDLQQMPHTAAMFAGKTARTAIYDRKRAAAYADRWWEAGNPAYLEFAVDCSNYVSQCLFAGGAPMNYTNKRGSGWWYRGQSGKQELWSYSWAVADSLRRFLASSGSGLKATQVHSPQELAEGDIISYSWLGNGHYGHSTVVAAIDGQGMPLVNAHTVSSKHRYWDYQDSYAWTAQTLYRFYHISDSFN